MKHILDTKKLYSNNLYIKHIILYFILNTLKYIWGLFSILEPTRAKNNLLKFMD